MNIHEKYITRGLHLAKNGLGTTYPNPLVGSVVVHQGQIIGEGWHQKAGQPHAEVNAISSVKTPELLKESTIYVNLEPCFHFGKTPPCCDLILHHNIPNVVIANQDPFDKVAGQSIQKLKAKGKNVIVGVLENAAWLLNKRFFTFHQQKRPWIILKWAASADGFLAPAHQPNQAPVWLSNEVSRQMVHQWRSEEMAILVGTNTVIKDNPSLTTRDWFGKSPKRFILDLNGKLNPNYKVFDDSAETQVISYQSNKNYPAHIICHVVDAQKDLWLQVFKILYDLQIQSIIIEGGAATLQSLIAQDLWDEARIFKTDITLNQGIKAPSINGVLTQKTNLLNNQLSILYHESYQKYHL